MLAWITGCASSPSPRSPSAAATPESRFDIAKPEGPTPWTHLEPRASAESFQFAIVTDRTGGMRPGIFSSAVDKLNLLEPEFVMSVGDLISGYTEDRAELGRQWDEFEGIVARLNAPFFYVPGNHDITNPVMREIWNERFGLAHYSFVYKNVLFVCLDSMDGGHHHIGDDQLTWLETTLEEYPNVAWTLLFMHTPLWDPSEGVEGRETTTPIWDKVESILGQRKYTAFAGHHHRYLKTHRHDHNLYTLATTGGGSSLRGPLFGEFDHVTWVTMTPEGPLLANLLLDGILPDDVRTDKLRYFHHSLQRGALLKPKIVLEAAPFTKAETSVRLRNDQDFPISFTLSSSSSEQLEVSPNKTEVTLAPNSVRDVNFTLSSKSQTQDSLPLTAPFQWHATATDHGQQLEAYDRSTFVVTKPLRAERVESIRVDGNLKEWGTLSYRVKTPLMVLKNSGSLHGPADNSFSVGLKRDNKAVYVAISVIDDSVSAKPDVAPWHQDGLEVRIDARIDGQRTHNGGARDALDFALIGLSPNQNPAKPWLYIEPWMLTIPGLQTACVKTDRGYAAELSIPLSFLKAQGGVDSFRINIAVDDRDPDGESQSWWWPDWRTGADVPGTGTAVLEK